MFKFLFALNVKIKCIKYFKCLKIKCISVHTRVVHATMHQVN